MVRDLSLAHDRLDLRDLRGLDVGLQVRAAAVLPGLDAARTDGRPAARAGCVLQRGGKGGETARSVPRQGKGHRELCRLRRYRQPALLPTARPAVAAAELR